MNEGMDALGRVRAQALVLLVLAFLAGAFAGGAIERLAVREARAAARPTRGFGRGTGSGRVPGGSGAGAGFPSYYDQLGLSPEQRASIEQIVSKRSARVDSVRKNSMDIVFAARDSTRKEVDAVLSADQRKKLDSLRPRGGRGGFGPPGFRGSSRQRDTSKAPRP